MKKLLLSLFAVTSFGAGAQVTIFEDSFETYQDFAITNFGAWSTVDIDGLNTYIGGTDYGVDEADSDWANAGAPQAWQIFNPSTATVTVVATGNVEPIFNDLTGAGGETRNFDPRTGSKYAASWAGVPTAEDPGPNDGNNDLLVSPPIALGASNNVVNFWVKALSDDYDVEQFRVYIYTGTGTPTSVAQLSTQISGLTVQTAGWNVWQEKTYNIPASAANTTVRIVIRNVGVDHYMLMVDDFKVTSSNMAVNDVLAKKFSVYPNPSNDVINISSSEAIAVNQISITDLNGRVVKTNNFDAVAQAQVNISDLTTGVYMMKITSPEGVAIKRIVRN